MSGPSSSFQYLLNELADEHDSEVRKLQTEKGDLQSQLDDLQAKFFELSKRSGANNGPSPPSPSASPRVKRGRLPASEHEGREWEFNMSDKVSCCTDTSGFAWLVWLYWLTHRMLSSAKFEFAVAGCVTASAIVSACQMQYSGLEAGFQIGFPDIPYKISASHAWAEDVFETADNCFTTLFTLELALRLTIFRLSFFHHWLNWLDVIAVTVGLANLAVDGAGQQASVVRLMRLLKLARGLRLVKLTRVLESLHFLLQSMRASLATLFWSLCVLMIIQCIAGMILSQLVQDYISGSGAVIQDLSEADLVSRRAVFAYYGTFTRTMITMFEIHLANWAPACRVLVDNIGESYGFVFVAYRCLAGFAVLNVINAVFIQQTLKVAQQDQHVMIMQKEKAQEQNRRNIMGLFQELDKSGDGLLSKDEFNALLTDKRLKTWLSCLEIDMVDIENLFKILERGGGEITATEFMYRLSSIKGPAKSIDMAELLARTSRIETKLNKFASDEHSVNSTPRKAREDACSGSSSCLGTEVWVQPKDVSMTSRRLAKKDTSESLTSSQLKFDDTSGSMPAQSMPAQKKLDEVATSLRDTAASSTPEPGFGLGSSLSLRTAQASPWCAPWPGCLR